MFGLKIGKKKNVLTVITPVTSRKIVGLKDVWIQKIMGVNYLMYEDCKHPIQALYFSEGSEDESLKVFINELWKAYNRGDKVLKLA